MEKMVTKDGLLDVANKGWHYWYGVGRTYCGYNDLQAFAWACAIMQRRRLMGEKRERSC